MSDQKTNSNLREAIAGALDCLDSAQNISRWAQEEVGKNQDVLERLVEMAIEGGTEAEIRQDARLSARLPKYLLSKLWGIPYSSWSIPLVYVLPREERNERLLGLLKDYCPEGTIGPVLILTREELLQIPGFDETCLEALREHLDLWDLLEHAQCRPVEIESPS